MNLNFTKILAFIAAIRFTVPGNLWQMIQKSKDFNKCFKLLFTKLTQASLN